MKNSQQKNVQKTINPQPQRVPPRRNSGPEQLHIDSLAIMLDEELSGLAERLEEERLSVLKSGQRTREYEEEIAFVRREQQVRSLRRRAHTAYLESVQRENVEQDFIERTLPNFDDRCNKEFADAWWRWGH